MLHLSFYSAPPLLPERQAETNNKPCFLNEFIRPVGVLCASAHRSKDDSARYNILIKHLEPPVACVRRPEPPKEGGPAQALLVHNRGVGGTTPVYWPVWCKGSWEIMLWVSDQLMDKLYPHSFAFDFRWTTVAAFVLLRHFLVNNNGSYKHFGPCDCFNWLGQGANTHLWCHSCQHLRLDWVLWVGVYLFPADQAADIQQLQEQHRRPLVINK